MRLAEAMALAHEKGTADLAVRDSLTWKPLRLLSFYRLILAGLLTVLFYGLSETGFGSANPALYILTCIVYIGFSLLYEWVVEVWARFTRIDAMIVMTILVTIAATNFLWGIGIGMVLTIVLFLVNYSRIDVVRYRLTGDSFQSRFKRGIEDARLLEQHSHHLGHASNLSLSPVGYLLRDIGLNHSVHQGNDPIETRSVTRERPV